MEAETSVGAASVLRSKMEVDVDVSNPPEDRPRNKPIFSLRLKNDSVPELMLQFR